MLGLGSVGSIKSLLRAAQRRKRSIIGRGWLKFAPRQLSTQIHPSAQIHPSVQLADGARIGRDCEVGPFCVIGPTATLEAGVTLRSHVVINGVTQIGENSTIHPFVSLGATPQDLKYRGELSPPPWRRGGVKRRPPEGRRRACTRVVGSASPSAAQAPPLHGRGEV